jgi:hypothetical protein
MELTEKEQRALNLARARGPAQCWRAGRGQALGHHGDPACSQNSKEGGGMTDKKPVGRPRVLTQALKTEICERIAEGETLREICRSEHIPSRSVIHKELLDDQSFADQYARARELQLDMMEDELLEIADDASNDWMERHDKEGNSIGCVINGEHIQRSRARIDTRKWIMSKRAPKKYGERVTQEIGAQGSTAVAFPVVRIYGAKPEEPDAA